MDIDPRIDEKYIPRILRLVDAHRGKRPVLSITLTSDNAIDVRCGDRLEKGGSGICLIIGEVNRRWKVTSLSYWIS